MRIKALGALALDGHEFRRPKPLLVGTYVCLNGPTSRRRLCELFWPEASDARDSLSTTLRRLNGLGSEPLFSTGDPVGALVRCDVAEFLDAMSSGEHARALELYGGRFLADLDLQVGEEVEEWIYATAERIAHLARRAHLALAHEARGRRDLSSASRYAEAALDLDATLTWEEDQLVAVMEHLHAADNPRAREAQNLAQTQGVPFSLPGDAGPRADGGAQIPRPGTSFVGREAELDEIDELLFSGIARLLTLHGPGGAGKSRLAAEVALAAVDRNLYPGAVYFVNLEVVREDEMVAGAVAAAMRLVLPPWGAPEEHIVKVLASRPALLLLDNCEHLPGTANFVAALLRSCPNVDVIVTSRVTLGLVEEHVMSLTGLRVDGPTGESDALQLLIARMRQHGTLARITGEDELAAQDICLAVDGNPLAIELAAAQTRFLSLSEVKRELGDGASVLVSRDPTAPERQRSLQAALDISWNLLTESDRRLLAKLAVFRGGFTRGAGLAIAGADATALRRLVDASFLRVLTNGRLERHPIVLQYSVGRLAEEPDLEQDSKRRHAEHFVGALRARDFEILGGTGTMALLNWIEEEFSNLEAALSWCVRAGDLGSFEAVGLVLAHFAELRGRFADVAKLLEMGVAAAEELRGVGDDAPIANTLGALPFTYFRLGRYHDSLATGRRALDAAGSLPDEACDWSKWAARQGMALSSLVLGNFEQAWQLALTNVEERVDVPADAPVTDRGRCIRDVTVGTSLQTLAFMDVHLGKYDAALEKLERAMSLFEPFKAPNLGYVYWTLGQTLVGKGDLDRAGTTLERGLEVAHETGFRNQVGHILTELALVRLLCGDAVKADALARQAFEAALTSGDKWLEATVLGRWGLAASRAGAEEIARERFVSAIEVASAAHAYPFAMEAVLGIADLLVANGKPAAAAMLMSYVRESPLAGAFTSAWAARSLEAVMPALLPDEFEATAQAVRSLTPDGALALAKAEAGGVTSA